MEYILLEQIKTGEVKAFEMLYKTYYSRLCLYSYKYVHEKSVAESIVNDVFVSFWNNKNKTIIKTSLSAYLYRSVHNLTVNYLEREVPKQLKTVSRDDENVSLTDKDDHSFDSPGAELLVRELQELIDAVIQELPAQCREVFVLSRLEGLSTDEIASQLNLSPNTVRVQLFRALSKLRKALGNYYILMVLIYPMI